MERITDVGGKVLGVVLNRMGPSADGYYYYYSYCSYYSRGATYAARRTSAA